MSRPVTAKNLQDNGSLRKKNTVTLVGKHRDQKTNQKPTETLPWPVTAKNLQAFNDCAPFGTFYNPTNDYESKFEEFWRNKRSHQRHMSEIKSKKMRIEFEKVDRSSDRAERKYARSCDDSVQYEKPSSRRHPPGHDDGRNRDKPGKMRSVIVKL